MAGSLPIIISGNVSLPLIVDAGTYTHGSVTLPRVDAMAAKDAAWSKFGTDPEWKKLSTTPGYTDPEIVSNISNVLLRPAPYSQI